jgi:hypothetical protein
MSVAALGGSSRLLNSKWFHYLMALRLKMHVLQIGLVCWALTGFAVSAQAQKSYSTTRYRGQQLLEERQVYETNNQLNFESTGTFQTMSPDRWSMPPRGSRPRVVSQSGELKSQTASNLTKKFKVASKSRDAELKVPAKKTSDSYWSQAGIDISLEQGFRRSEITKRPSVDFSPPVGYPAAECDWGESGSPTFEEILRTGRFFSSANVSFLKPVLQGDVAFDISGSAGQFHDNFEYDYNSASQFSLGFESLAGPGINVSYWEFDGASETASWTNPDVNHNLQTIDFGGLLGGRGISTRGFDDTVTVTDALDIQRIEASFYKDIKFKVSRMSGRFGFQWIEINRQTNALYAETFFEGGETHTWAGADQFQGAGPTFGFDYFRPIGHTKIEFLASGDCGLSFGHRDKVVKVVVNADFDNGFETPDIVFQNGGDDEFLTNLNLFMGVQYVISRGGNRCFYLRSGLDYQAWLGADNTTASNSDFGLRGFSVTLGYNR